MFAECARDCRHSAPRRRGASAHSFYRARRARCSIAAMTIDELAAGIRGKVSMAPPLGHTVKFDLGDDGVILWDGTGSQPVVSTEDGEAETTMRLSAEDLGKLLAGALNPTLAYMTGKLKVDGSMGVAMKISQLLED
jgi:putative sterol carrier protein